MADYKLPTVIYSQKYLPDNGGMLNVRPYYVPDNSTLIAQENKLYADIIDNDVFQFFANSFLVECSESEDLGKVTFASPSNRRSKEYQVITRCIDNQMFEKYAIDSKVGNVHIKKIVENEKALRERGLKVWSSEMKDGKSVSQRCRANLSESVLLQYVKSGDRNDVWSMMDLLYQQIL